MEPALLALRAGRPARSVAMPPNRLAQFRQLQLLTGKPVLYACNVDESAAATGNALSARVLERAAAEGAGAIVISAAIEAEVAVLDDAEDKRAYLEALGLAETGLARLIRAGYALLDLLTFFTAGPKEARAWTVRRGAKAPEAAGVIHTDFERGFIRAETIAYADFVACGGEQGAKEAGRMRAEGRDYAVQDGDVFHFRFNV
jgi:ribosome-binding ATPase YchF (GTP1/OBG family)